MNEQKFTKVFNKYNRLVRKMVISRTGDRMLAEELCQQVFLQYFERMDTIDDDLIQPWLLLTMKNMIYDYYRKQNIRNHVHSAAPMEEVMVVYEDNAECVVSKLSHSKLTERILGELYAEHWEWYDVIVDICILQMSYEEAAKHLHLSVEVLRAKLYRARRYIRKQYGKEYSEL